MGDGIAGRLAGRPVGERSIVVLDVARPTLVLGSSQPDDAAVDRARVAERGIEVVRRHSGGAAVLVEPGAAVWVDVTIPAGEMVANRLAKPKSMSRVYHSASRCGPRSRSARYVNSMQPLIGRS